MVWNKVCGWRTIGMAVQIMVMADGAHLESDEVVAA